MTHVGQPVTLKIYLKPGYGPPGNTVEVLCNDLWWKETVSRLQTEGIYWEISRSNGDVEMGWAAPESIKKIVTIVKNGQPHI